MAENGARQSSESKNADKLIKDGKNELKEKYVKIRLPRMRKDEEDVFVSVNERTWLIKRGVDVEVPECVAEVIRHREEALEEAYDFENAAREK